MVNCRRWIKDDTEEIVKTFSEEHFKIRYIKQENGVNISLQMLA